MREEKKTALGTGEGRKERAPRTLASLFSPPPPPSPRKPLRTRETTSVKCGIQWFTLLQLQNVKDLAFLFSGSLLYRHLSLRGVIHLLWSWYHFARFRGWHQSYVYTSGNIHDVQKHSYMWQAKITNKIFCLRSHDDALCNCIVKCPLAVVRWD